VLPNAWLLIMYYWMLINNCSVCFKSVKRFVFKRIEIKHSCVMLTDTVTDYIYTNCDSMLIKC